MDTKVEKLIMLGAAPETRSSIAAVVEAYRANGLFRRWPIEFIATHGDGAASHRAGVTMKALKRFGALVAQHRRVALHVNTAAGSHFWRDSIFMSAAIAARCPIVLHVHGGGFDDFYNGAGQVGRGMIRWFLERTARIAVPSERLRAWVRSVCPNAPVTFIPSPVSMPPAHDAARPNLILFLGRLEPAKGIVDLLEAVSALRAAVPDVRLVCAGDGDRIGVARYAERLGIADAVKFTGWVGPSGKRALLESAAVFALPSYSENMPISLLEAMAAGVPSVATPVGGIPEVLVDGVSGFLAAPGDVATLSRVLRKLLIDRKLGARIGAAGRESVRLRFAAERALPRLEELYADIGLRSFDEPSAPAREIDLKKAA